MKRHLMIVAAAAGLCAASFPMQAAAHDEPVIGVVGGAAAGGLIAGPPGAVAGAVIGAIAGATVAHETDHGHHRHGYRTHVHSVAPVRYVETVRYVESPACAPPQEVYYRPASVRYEAYPKATKTVAVAKPKLRKVCRYERVRATNTAAVKSRPVG